MHRPRDALGLEKMRIHISNYIFLFEPSAVKRPSPSLIIVPCLPALLLSSGKYL